MTAFLTFRVKGMRPELWDAETGSITHLTAYQTVTDGIEIPLSFPGFGSVFIIFRSPLSIAGLMLGKEIVKNKTILLQTTQGVGIVNSGPLTGSKEGKKFSQQIELPQPIVLNGPWILRLPKNGYAPPRDTFLTLMPLNHASKDRLKYFSGTLAYHHDFSFAKTESGKDMRI
ncbi:MAG: hypothetical protein EOO04_31560, partial [Chitinophagaceae bacterium]